MPTEPAKSLKLFYCYAREDKALRDELDKHLSSLKREHQITSWSDKEILLEFPDTTDNSEISRHEVALIIKHGSNDPFKGYNHNPKFRG